MTACEKADAILFGAMGWPDIRYPDGTEIAPQLDLRVHAPAVPDQGRPYAVLRQPVRGGVPRP